MTDESPIACSLNPRNLQQRLDEIAKLGAESLVIQETEGDRQLLRFCNDAETRKRLEALIAAESQCCPFLDLSLAENDDELVLTVVSAE